MSDQITLENNDRERRYKRILLELLAIGFVGLLVFKLSYDLPASRDLPSTDEPGYIQYADELETHGLPSAAWSPLYVAFYYAESFVSSDRIDLFDLHWLIITSLLSLSGYCVMRRLQISRPVALCGTFLILSSNFIFIDPMPPHLATVVLGIGTAVALCFRKLSASLAAAGITLGIASFIRPELAPLLAVFSIISLLTASVILVKNSSHWKSIAGSAAVFGAGVAVLVVLFGNPMKDSRGFEAFGQHYAYNVWQYGEKVNNDPWSLWKDYIERDFPEAESIGDAVKADPGAFVWHIRQNIINFGKYFCRVIHLRLDIPNTAAWVLLSGWVLAGLAGLVVAVRRLKQEGYSLARWPWALWLMLAVVLIQVAATSILIYPAMHYFISFSFFLFIATSWGVDRLLHSSRWRTSLSAQRVLTITGLVLLACLPNRSHGWNPQRLVGLRDSDHAASFLVYRETSRTLEQIAIDRPVTILGQHSVFARYADLRFREVVPHETRKTESLWDYFDEHQITLAIIHAKQELRLFGEDPLDHPPDDFRLYPVKNSPLWIAVHEEVLQDRIARR